MAWPRAKGGDLLAKAMDRRKAMAATFRQFFVPAAHFGARGWQPRAKAKRLEQRVFV
jgi:hypothetical protein